MTDLFTTEIIDATMTSNKIAGAIPFGTVNSASRFLPLSAVARLLVSGLKYGVRQYICKLVSVSLLLVACRAHAFYPEHVWAIGPAGNSYGMAQWNDSNASGAVAGHKRTVIYFGSHQWVVHHSAASVLGVGLLGISVFGLSGMWAGSRIQRQQSHDRHAS
jgi:hypothetical protein